MFFVENKIALRFSNDVSNITMWEEKTLRVYTTVVINAEY